MLRQRADPIVNLANEPLYTSPSLSEPTFSTSFPANRCFCLLWSVVGKLQARSAKNKEPYAGKVKTWMEPFHLVGAKHFHLSDFHHAPVTNINQFSIKCSARLASGRCEARSNGVGSSLRFAVNLVFMITLVFVVALTFCTVLCCFIGAFRPLFYIHTR